MQALSIEMGTEGRRDCGVRRNDSRAELIWIVNLDVCYRCRGP